LAHLAGTGEKPMGATTITVRELHEIRRGGKPVDLIDVRTPVEFREAHVEGARLVPLDGLDPRAVMTRRGGATGPPIPDPEAKRRRSPRPMGRGRIEARASPTRAEWGCYSAVSSVSADA
jgi:hypothetical protein